MRGAALRKDVAKPPSCAFRRAHDSWLGGIKRQASYATPRRATLSRTRYAKYVPAHMLNAARWGNPQYAMSSMLQISVKA